MLSVASLTLAPGASGSATLKVSSPAGAAPGAYTITVSTSDSLQALHAASVNGTDTVTAPDTAAPSAPTNLAGKVVKQGNGKHATNAASLSWTAATDNVGVAHYNIIRNGTTVATSTTTSFTDKPGSGTFTYQVNAVDAAGNVSPNSNSVSVTIP
jgi:hypothetical protein